MDDQKKYGNSKQENKNKNNNKNLFIGIIAKWIPSFGKDNNSPKNIESQWFLMDIITRDEFFENIEDIYDTLNFYKRNYNGNKNHVKLALVNPKQLPSKEIITIDHTYYVRLIQRMWRKKRMERMYNEK